MQKTLRASDVSEGQALPDLDVPTTATLVVGGAIASRDYTPVHHSAAEAQAQGLPDVFMNILTTQGLCSRYVTDWAGTRRPDPEASRPSWAVRTCRATRSSCAARSSPRTVNCADIEVAGNNVVGQPRDRNPSPLELP